MIKQFIFWNMKPSMQQVFKIDAGIFECKAPKVLVF